MNELLSITSMLSTMILTAQTQLEDRQDEKSEYVKGVDAGALMALRVVRDMVARRIDELDALNAEAQG